MVHFLPQEFLKTSGMYPSGEIMLDTFSFLHCRRSGVVLNSRITRKIQTLPQCCIFDTQKCYVAYDCWQKRHETAMKYSRVSNTFQTDPFRSRCLRDVLNYVDEDIRVCKKARRSPRTELLGFYWLSTPDRNPAPADMENIPFSRSVLYTVNMYTWSPNDPCFDWKDRPCFGGFEV